MLQTSNDRRVAALCVARLRPGAASPEGCRSRQPPTAVCSALADAFLDGYFERNPDQITLYGVPGRHHDRLPDNSLDALEGVADKGRQRG